MDVFTFEEEFTFCESNYMKVLASKERVYHIRSGKSSRLRVNMKLESIATEGSPLMVHFKLRRINREYSNVPVIVCHKHAESLGAKNPIVPSQSEKKENLYKYSYLPDGTLVFRCDTFDGFGSALNETAIIGFICNDSCKNYEGELKKVEAPRDLELTISVRTVVDDVEKVLLEETVYVWIKTSVCPRDLKKDMKRKAKGALALQLKMRKMKEGVTSRATQTEGVYMREAFDRRKPKEKKSLKRIEEEMNNLQARQNKLIEELMSADKDEEEKVTSVRNECEKRVDDIREELNTIHHQLKSHFKDFYL